MLTDPVSFISFVGSAPTSDKSVSDGFSSFVSDDLILTSSPERILSSSESNLEPNSFSFVVSKSSDPTIVKSLNFIHLHSYSIYKTYTVILVILKTLSLLL